MRSLQFWNGKGWIRFLLVLALMSVAAPQPVFSQQEDPAALPTWTKMAVDAPPYFTNMTDRSLAFHPPSGVPCVAFGGDALYYSCWNTITLVWDTIVLDNNAQVGEYAAMRFDNFGRPFITYYDSKNARLKLAYWTGTIWDFMIVPNVDGFADQPQFDASEIESELPSVSPNTALVEASAEPVEPMEQPIQPPTDSVYAVASDSEAVEEPDPRTEPAAADEEPTMAERVRDFLQPWLSELGALSPNFPFDSLGYGKHSSLYIDRNNGIHISYFDEIDGSLEYLYWNGLTWVGKVVDDYSDQGDVGLWSSIAVDYNFFVHIAYMSEKYDDLKYARRNATGGWTIDTVDSAANVGSFASIAVEPNNKVRNRNYFRPHISYYDFTGDRLKHAWLDNNLVWQKEVIDANGITGWYTSIAIDPSNRIHISYYKASTGDLKYARYDGSWSVRSLDVTGTLNVGMFTSVAIDRFGRPGIAYVHTSLGALKFIYSPGSSNWRTPTWVSYYSRDVGQSSSLAISPSGVPFISYQDATMGSLKLARPYGSSWSRVNLINRPYSGLYSSIDLIGEFPRIAFYEQEFRDLDYARYLGMGLWDFQGVDEPFDVGQYVSMELDTLGLPHMSYYDATRQDLLYAYWDIAEGDWMTDTVDFEGTVGWYTNIAVDAANRVFISYYDPTSGSLKLAFRSPITLTWIKTVVDNIGQLQQSGVGAYTSVDVDNLGRPHISYYDLTNKMLKYAYWDGVWGGAGVWNRTVVDPFQDTGRFSSLVINQADNTSHICYYDYTRGNLKYAQWIPGGAWQRQMVDGDPVNDGDGIDEGDVGLYCSIDLNAAGMPAISYYSNSHADLKLAISYALPPASMYLPLMIRNP